jgi:hypothetical protein
VSFSPGVYEGISSRDYHADPALGSTSLKTLATKTPAHWKWEREHPVQKDAYDIGTITHSLVLEQDESGVVVVEAENWLTKAAKEAKAEARAAGKIPLLPKDWAQVKAMRDSIMAHPAARHAFTGHQAEVSFFWDEDGLMLKCRPDAWQQGYLVDLKTTVNADPRSFPKLAYDLGYYQSAAHYQDGTHVWLGETLPFVFVLVEKSPPYLVSVVELDDYAIRRGREVNHGAKEIYRKCLATDTWPGYPDAPPLGLPRWATRQLEENLDDIF